MKMKKKALVLVAAFATMTMMLTGCGAEKSDAVKVGFVGPLTGGNAATGIGLKNSAQLAVDEANASNKYKHKFELVIADDGGNPSTAVSAANKLISNKDIVAVFGHFNSGAALATVPIFHKNGMPILVTAAIHPDITKAKYKEVTRIATPANVQNEFAAKTAVEDWGVKTIALINDKTDYGKTNATQFGENSKKLGATIISEDGISVGQQDFSALLTKIKAENPEAIYFGGVATEAALIKRQMADLQMDCLFLSDSGIISDTFNKIAGSASAGMIAFNIGKPLEDLPGGKAFEKAYADAKFAEPHEAYGHFAYDSANVVMAAIEKAGEKGDITRSTVATAIRATKNAPCIIGSTTFNKRGENTLELITTYISEDGKWVPYYKATTKVVDKKIVKQ